MTPALGRKMVKSLLSICCVALLASIIGCSNSALFHYLIGQEDSVNANRISTVENELYVLTLEVPDNVDQNERFTASGRLDSKVQLDYAALTLILPEGMTSPDTPLAESQQSMNAGVTLTGEFTVRANKSGSYTLTLSAREQPLGKDSQLLSTTVVLEVSER